MKVVAVVPARLASRRLPRKPLRILGGVPLLLHVVRRLEKSSLLDGIFVATGDGEIVRLAESFGISTVRTPRELPSGTDRVAVAAVHLQAEIVVNIQADEPLVQPEHIEALLAGLESDPVAVASTLRFPLAPEEAADPHRVKVVVGAHRRALYFSRQPLAQEEGRFFKHLGMYAYRRQSLELFRRLPVAPQERAEGLEQLRLLDAGLPIVVADAPIDAFGVDTPEDLRRLQELFRQGERNA